MTPQSSARAAFFLRRLLMSEFGGLLCSPSLAACFARQFGGLLCSPGGAFACAPFSAGIGTEVLVGLDRLELSTSPLSGARSSHLSYRPLAAGRGLGCRLRWPVWGQSSFNLVELVGIEPATS